MRRRHRKGEAFSALQYVLCIHCRQQEKAGGQKRAAIDFVSRAGSPPLQSVVSVHTKRERTGSRQDSARMDSARMLTLVSQCATDVHSIVTKL